MNLPRIYQPIALKLHQDVLLDEQASHHLARVLRVTVGNELILFNGQGGEYLAKVKCMTKKNVGVFIESFVAKEVESPLDLHLAQGMARGEKMDFIVQKAVELGVKKFTPLITERCNVNLSKERSEKRLLHWQTIAMSACEQSGRNRVPEIVPPILLRDWLQTVKADIAFVLSPHVTQKLPEIKLKPDASVALLLGPEGGLSREEVDMAVKHAFLPLNLGERVLRTETATIAALTVIQYCYGDLR